MSLVSLYILKGFSIDAFESGNFSFSFLSILCIQSKRASKLKTCILDMLSLNQGSNFFPFLRHLQAAWSVIRELWKCFAVSVVRCTNQLRDYKNWCLNILLYKLDAYYCNTKMQDSTILNFGLFRFYTTIIVTVWQNCPVKSRAWTQWNKYRRRFTICAVNPQILGHISS